MEDLVSCMDKETQPQARGEEGFRSAISCLAIDRLVTEVPSMKLGSFRLTLFLWCVLPPWSKGQELKAQWWTWSQCGKYLECNLSQVVLWLAVLLSWPPVVQNQNTRNDPKEILESSMPIEPLWWKRSWKGLFINRNTDDLLFIKKNRMMGRSMNKNKKK